MPRCLRPLDADVEHLRIDVGDRHRGAGAGEAEGDVAGAAGHVEDRLALARRHPADERVLPQPVQAARHQVVHQVVARGDAGEDAAHPPRLFLGRRHPHSRRRPCPSRRASSRGVAMMCTSLSQRSMPELPEVETTVRGLAPVLEGRRIASVEPRRADLRRPFPPDLRQRLTGARVTGLGAPRQIRPDRHRPRRHAGLPSRHVGPLADRSRRRSASTTMS